jgi:hypothetical protein
MARRSAAAEEAPAPASEERCDLCGEPIPPAHRHLLDLRNRELMCACQPCKILFDRKEAGAGHYRLVPDRRLRIEDFELDDALWQSLRIPVDMAFFFYSTPAERTVAFYPGPMGATESLLELDAWRELAEANPVLGGLEPDVEALLVNRTGEASDHWIVPIDDCYALVGLIRTHWRGLSGGREVWTEIGGFFERLGRRARTANREGNRQRSSAPAVSAAGDGKE